MQDKTYTQLLELIKGLCGVDNFTTSEQTSLLTFVNRRAGEAYKLSQSWPRYLVVGEQRTISSSPAQTIPYTEASKNKIYEFIKIHREQPYLNKSSLEFEFYVDTDGAHILNISTTDSTSAYVTYKKELSVFTTSSTDIPEEWFNYIAHNVYADFLRMDAQTDKALAEESVAYNYIALELEKIDNIMNNNSIISKYSTHLSRASRW